MSENKNDTFQRLFALMESPSTRKEEEEKKKKSATHPLSYYVSLLAYENTRMTTVHVQHENVYTPPRTMRLWWARATMEFL